MNTLKPDCFFAVCALIFGLIFMVLTPPFQIPDEFNHFYRAYQISEGDFVAINHNQRLGGELPASLVKFSDPFRGIIMRGYVRIDYAVVLEQFHVPLKPDERIFIDFPNTGLYSPVSYFPQALSIFILRSFDLPPLYIFYGARLGTLLFWVLSIFFAIRWIPFYKWFVVLMALLPMSVFTNMSLSADVMTNLLAFLLIAYSLKLAYETSSVSARQVAVFALLCVLLALAKVVYIPLMLLFFFIPMKKFGSNRSYSFYLFALFFFSFVMVLFWSGVIKTLYIPYNMYNPVFREGSVMYTSIVPCANMQEQVQYILNQDWLYIPDVFYRSVIETFDMYSRGYIGTFGWLDTYLPNWFLYVAYTVLFFVASTDGKTSIAIKLRLKGLLVVAFVVSVSLLFLSQLLTWVCVGRGLLTIVQGRYVIPLFPLLFLLFYNNKWTYPKLVVPLVVVFSVFSLSYSSVMLYERYYQKEEMQTIHITCDTERVTTDGFYETSDSLVLLENGQTQSHERARSGSYAAKLSTKDPYALTYRLRGCKWGDSIKVDISRWGKHGVIVVSADEDEFSAFSTESLERDSLGWDRLHLKFRMPHNVQPEGVKIFMYYNEGNDSSYFDDLNITYYKLR